MQAETEAAEEPGLKEYKNLMEGSKVDEAKAANFRTPKHKPRKKQHTQKELVTQRPASRS